MTVGISLCSIGNNIFMVKWGETQIFEIVYYSLWQHVYAYLCFIEGFEKLDKTLLFGFVKGSTFKQYTITFTEDYPGRQSN